MTEEIAEPVSTFVSDTPADTQTETPAQDANPTESASSAIPESGDSETPENDGSDSTEEPNKGLQKRINKMTKKMRDAQREAEHWRNEALKNQQAQEQAPPAEKPKQQDFNSDAEFIEALTDWKVEQSNKAQRETQQEQTQQQSINEKRQAFTKSAKEVAKKYDDFNDVVGNENLAISETMEQVILESDIGPEIAYHLGKNLDIALDIAQMPPHMAAREIGKIEARLSMPAQKKTTSAPPPLKPLGSKNSSKPDPRKMSTEDWIKWRNNE